MKLDVVRAVAFFLSFPYRFSSFQLQPNCYKIKLQLFISLLVIQWHFTLILPKGSINKNLCWGPFLFRGMICCNVAQNLSHCVLRTKTKEEKNSFKY